MSSTPSLRENAMQEIAAAYFGAIESIRQEESKRWHLAHFKTTTDVIVQRLKQAKVNTAEAEEEINSLAALLKAYKVVPIKQVSVITPHIRPLMYCLTGSLICVGLLILIDLIHQGA